MSGHNKWANIKRRKESTDKKRAQIFSKLLRAISVAARVSPNIEANQTLKSAVEKARKFNVPQDNIDRAIKKSSEMKDVETLLVEMYGPEGIALLLEATTDNKNRTVSELKKIISDNEGKWADPGSVLWAFEKKDGEYHARFPQKLSEETEKKLLKLLEALDDHNDVDEVYSSADLLTENPQ